MKNFNETLEQVAENYKKATGKNFYRTLSNVQWPTPKLIITNFPALLKEFPYAAIYPVENGNRDKYSFAHILVKKYSKEGPDTEPMLGYYVTSAFKYKRDGDYLNKYVRLRYELIEEWKHNPNIGLIIFHKEQDNTFTYTVIEKDDLKDLIFNKENLTYCRDEKGVQWYDINIHRDIKDAVPTYYNDNVVFNTDFLPKFLSIGRINYSKYRSSEKRNGIRNGKKIVITAYSADGLYKDSFTYRSFAEAAAVLKQLKVNVSAKTVARHYVSKKPIEAHGCDQYDYYLISDEVGGDLTKDLIEKVSYVCPFDGETKEVEVPKVDTTVDASINVDDIVEVTDLDTGDILNDVPLQDIETVISETWTHPTIYKPQKVEERLDTTIVSWFRWKRNNPGKSYEEYIRETNN